MNSAFEYHVNSLCSAISAARSPVCSGLLITSVLLLPGCHTTIEIGENSPVTAYDAPVGNRSGSLAAIDDSLRQENIVQPHVEADKPHNYQPGQSWLSTIEDDFTVAKNLVEKELEVDLSHVRLQLVEDSPINTEVGIETRRLVKNQFGDGTFARQFLKQVMHPLKGTYAALYSSRLSSILISRSMLASYEQSVSSDKQPASAKRGALLTLLIHELVHAADDQRYRIHDNRALNFRASFAQSATYEGHAQWVTRTICEKVGCSTGLDALDDFMFGTGDQSPQLTQPVEAISRNVLEYSYVEGERFISELIQRPSGEQLLDDVLSNPPQDPIQILAPQTFPDTARENRNQVLIRSSREVSHPFTKKPWIGVETSPLKGVNLRADPERRKAAVEGFTELIRGMVSMQFYDQQITGVLPIEATLLQTEGKKTAQLFASMLHNNTQQHGAQSSDSSLRINMRDEGYPDDIDLRIYRTAIDGDTSFRTAIAVAGEYVVQVAGNTRDQDTLDDYAMRVIIHLNTPSISPKQRQLSQK